MTLRCVASGLGFPEGPIVDDDGSVLVSEIANGRISRVRPDGAVETFAETGAGPTVWRACPTAGSSCARTAVPGSPSDRGRSTSTAPCHCSCRRVLPTNPSPRNCRLSRARVRQLLTTTFTSISDDELPLARPSDICVDAQGGFYVTDGFSVQGRSRSITGVLYGTPDGQLSEIVYPLELPNGVALSPDGSKLYVAETRTRRIWQFEVLGPGRLGAARGLATVPSGGPMNFGGADGLCVAPDGTIIVATVGTGGVTAFSPDGQLLGAIAADDPMTTNVALSHDGCSLFITLASSGRLVVVDDWRTALTPIP